MSISKKLLSVFLAFVMLLIALPLSGIKTYATDPSDFSYDIIDDEAKTAELSDYSGSEEEVVIPSVIDGYTIVSIGMYAFQSGGSIVSLTIPSTVESIDQYALTFLTSLEELDVESGSSYYCSSNGVLFNDDMTSLIKFPGMKDSSCYVVPDTVEEIAPFAFVMSALLETVKFDANLNTISMYAFAYCMNLMSVSIPSGVTSIDSSAFKGCSCLTNVVFTEGLEEIYMEAFEECEMLTEIFLPASVTYCEDDPFLDSGLEKVYGYPSTYAETFAEDNGYDFVDVTAMTMGDMDFDDLRNETDIGIMMQMASGICDPSGLQNYLGDVNNDGVIDGFDIAALDVKLYENID